jgi:hypothetical protein
MIKIVKAGQKEFYATCDMCGCEFTYELSDLKLSCSLNKVACPTCGKDYYHKAQNGGGYGIDYLNWPQGAEPIPCIDQNKDPCAECDWMKTLLKNGTYVGDTPCTWCNKNKFSCTISGGTISSTVPYPEAHLNACTTSASECEVDSITTIHSASELEADREYVNQQLQKVYDASGVKVDDLTQGTVMSTILNACNNYISNASKCNDQE